MLLDRSVLLVNLAVLTSPKGKAPRHGGQTLKCKCRRCAVPVLVVVVINPTINKRQVTARPRVSTHDSKIRRKKAKVSVATKHSIRALVVLYACLLALSIVFLIHLGFLVLFQYGTSTGKGQIDLVRRHCHSCQCKGPGTHAVFGLCLCTTTEAGGR